MYKYTPADNLEQFINDNNLSSYRIKQFNKAYYQTLIEDFSSLTTWSKTLRQKLSRDMVFSCLEKIKLQVSADKKTSKVLFKRKFEKGLIESVLMQFDDNRNTICVSCMVGCPVGCKFCATGQMKNVSLLGPQEIIDQVLYFARFLKEQNKQITNIVFMGMGEPLLNLKNVIKARNIMIDPNKLGLGKRRVLLSTVGIINKIQTLYDLGYEERLAVSLHSANQQTRAKLIPLAKDNPLDKLMEELDQYVKKTNKRISYEYILLNNVNDSLQQAQELVDLLKNRLAHVNLMKYNSVPGLKLQGSSIVQIRQFSNYLSQAGINNTIRVSLGEDIDGACGQLSTYNSAK